MARTWSKRSEVTTHPPRSLPPLTLSLSGIRAANPRLGGRAALNPRQHRFEARLVFGVQCGAVS